MIINQSINHFNYQQFYNVFTDGMSGGEILINDINKCPDRSFIDKFLIYDLYLIKKST